MKKYVPVLLAMTFLASCSTLKLKDTAYATVTEAKTELDKYTFTLHKKAGSFIEIVEVKLLNNEKGMETSAPFQVTEVDGKKSILDVKGRSDFAVVATLPKSEGNELATSALIAYRAEQDGPIKYLTIKKF